MPQNKNKKITPRGQNQQAYVKSMDQNVITFALGPAGTGKTLLAVNHAISGLESDEYERIIVTRPLVQAGEEIGFLPGDLHEKAAPFIRPIMDQYDYICGKGEFTHAVNGEVVEIAPIAYMRGRTLHRACVIVDEAQNMTLEQIKMVTTRLGKDSTMIITGDPSQIDLNPIGLSGLLQASKILAGVPRVHTVVLNANDIRRATVVEDVVKAFQRHHARTNEPSRSDKNS